MCRRSDRCKVRGRSKGSDVTRSSDQEQKKKGCATGLLQIASRRRLRREKAEKCGHAPLPASDLPLARSPNGHLGGGGGGREDTRKRPPEPEKEVEEGERRPALLKTDSVLDHCRGVLVVGVEGGEVQAEVVGHEGLEGASAPGQVRVEPLVLRQLEEALQPTQCVSVRFNLGSLERGESCCSSGVAPSASSSGSCRPSARP